MLAVQTSGLSHLGLPLVCPSTAPPLSAVSGFSAAVNFRGPPCCKGADHTPQGLSKIIVSLQISPDLRRTSATLLLAQGVPLRVVMESLGHSQMATTADIYAHVLPVLMADAAERMDAALA